MWLDWERCGEGCTSLPVSGDHRGAGGWNCGSVPSVSFPHTLPAVSAAALLTYPGYKKSSDSYLTGHISLLSQAFPRSSLRQVSKKSLFGLSSGLALQCGHNVRVFINRNLTIISPQYWFFVGPSCTREGWRRHKIPQAATLMFSFFFFISPFL